MRAVSSGNAAIAAASKKLMLHVFAEADASRVRAHRLVERRSQKQYGQHFVHPAESASVELYDVDSVSL